jgi:hypothetical protein
MGILRFWNFGLVAVADRQVKGCVGMVARVLLAKSGPRRYLAALPVANLEGHGRVTHLIWEVPESRMPNAGCDNGVTL